jgi:broad specificity phosphatase PhoE
MTSACSCTVFIVRHGETEWNRCGRWQGHSDVPLSAAGRAQAARLARRLAEEGARFDALYSSDLRRAWETAEAVGGALGLRPAASPALREIDLGRWAGKTRAEIAAAYPGEWKKLEQNEDFARGGGETFAAFQKRVIDWLEHAVEKHPGGRILAVTHGGCIRAAALHVLDLTWADRDRIPAIENGSITVLESTAAGWRIQRINDARGVRDPEAETAQTEKIEGEPG